MIEFNNDQIPTTELNSTKITLRGVTRPPHFIPNEQTSQLMQEGVNDTTIPTQLINKNMNYLSPNKLAPKTASSVKKRYSLLL